MRAFWRLVQQPDESPKDRYGRMAMPDKTQTQQEGQPGKGSHMPAGDCDIAVTCTVVHLESYCMVKMFWIILRAMVWKMFRIISKDGYCGAPGNQRSGDRWTGTVEACRGKLENRGVPPWPEAGNECGRLPVREGPCVALAYRTGTQGVPGFWTLLLQDRLLLGSHQSEDFSGSRQGIQGKTLDRTLPGNCISPKYLVSSQLHRFFAILQISSIIQFRHFTYFIFNQKNQSRSNSI